MTIRVFAAGSLKAVFCELGAAFEARRGESAQFVFGPSGLLRDRLLAGDHADLFASANMEHPLALENEGIAGPVRRFTHNCLCALAAPGLHLSSATLLERMLDPAVRIGTSTPKTDPSGDYAFEFFARVERRYPGAGRRLAAKARKLIGGASSPLPATDRCPYTRLIEEGAADVFLTYRTNALQAIREAPDQQIIDIPGDLNVGADYGLTMLGGNWAAREFADFLVSPAGQEILVRQGFARIPACPAIVARPPMCFAAA